MCEKYLIIKKENELSTSKAIDECTFEILKSAAVSLEMFNTVIFLSNSYVKAKEDFFAYDFTQFNVREVDMFNMFLNALEAMATNRNLWEAYLERNYASDNEIFPDVINGRKRSCFGLKDSQYYDASIDYVVSKVLRNMIAHHSKPYSEIVYYDDYCRRFIVTKEDLLELGAPNISAKKYITNSQHDYYDIVEVIKHALEITEEINIFMFNLIMKKEWYKLWNARDIIREHIGDDWQGAYLVWKNLKYPEDHLLHLSQIDISKHAMHVIMSIMTQSLASKSCSISEDLDARVSNNLTE